MATDLREIPPDYVAAFNEAVHEQYDNREANNTSEQRAVLAEFLEQVQGRNAFVQPNAQIAYIDATTEEITAAIARRETANSNDEKRASPKVVWGGGVLFALLAIALVSFLWWSRPSAQAARLEAAEATELDDASSAVSAGIDIAPTPTLEPLPPISQDALLAIGGNGERLDLGQPSSIELRFVDEEVVALPISPAGLTDVGALRYQEEIMLGETPVAVWLANTRLNYGIGIPRDVVRRLEIGNRATLFTNTGVEIPFIIREKQVKQSYQTADILKQDEIGMSLFALPAIADDEVDVAIAVYDVSQERRLGAAMSAGSRYRLGNLAVRVDSEIVVNQLPDGRVEVIVSGELEGAARVEQQILLNLTTNSGQQTGIAALQVGKWQHTFALPRTSQGQGVIAEIRLLPESELIAIQLPTIAVLTDGLSVSVEEAWLNPDSEEVVIMLTYENVDDNGTVWLSSDEWQAKHPDGQPLMKVGSPALPIGIDAGETLTQDMMVVPEQPKTPIIITVVDQQWEVILP